MPLERDLPCGNIYQKTNKIGNLHYKVKLDDGRVWRRHVGQIRSAAVKENNEIDITPTQHYISHVTSVMPTNAQTEGQISTGFFCMLLPG